MQQTCSFVKEYQEVSLQIKYMVSFDVCTLFPFQYKLGLIHAIIDRIYKINNNWFNFERDIKKLRETLSRNLFPNKLFDKILNPFTNKQFLNSEMTEDNTNAKRFFKLPYIGEHSISLKNKVKNFVERY